VMAVTWGRVAANGLSRQTRFLWFLRKRGKRPMLRGSPLRGEHLSMKGLALRLSNTASS
jgi:hypothetical protein